MATIEEQSYDTNDSNNPNQYNSTLRSTASNNSSAASNMSPPYIDTVVLQQEHYPYLPRQQQYDMEQQPQESSQQQVPSMNHQHHQLHTQQQQHLPSNNNSNNYNNNFDLPSTQPSLQQHPHSLGVPVMQQQQKQQPKQMSNTPWTLGSTDATQSTAYYSNNNNNINNQQQQQQQQADGVTALLALHANISSSAAATPIDTPISKIAPQTTHNVLPSPMMTPPPTSSPTSILSNSQKQQIVSPSVPNATTNVLAGDANVGAVVIPGAVISSNTGEAAATTPSTIIDHHQQQQQQQRSLYHDRLVHQGSDAVEAVLSASCEVMGFDIVEMWLRTGPKTHLLTNSHLRPTALEDSVRKDLVDVYYGEKSNERTHRLSPALCKRAKEVGDVVWITAHTRSGIDTLRCSISNVRTAVAVPICHESSNTNITIIFFSIRRIIVRPTSVEFLVHMSLAAGVASVNSLAQEGHETRANHRNGKMLDNPNRDGVDPTANKVDRLVAQSEHGPPSSSNRYYGEKQLVQRYPRAEKVSVTGASLDVQWRQLANVEYLTDGGNSWIHTAVYNGKPVVIKTLKPECQDVVLAINEIETELAIHSRLNHVNIVSLVGAGTTSKGVRFFVLERLDGGTLTQRLGYDTRIRDRRKRFWRKKAFSYVDVLRIAKSIAEAMAYCHESAVPGCIVLHRDLKPDNIGFTLDGTVKILDFGLAKIIESASIDSDDVYAMSGETGSLRYMSPEVAAGEPYNYSADVYSFGIILWEMNATKKPFEGLSRDLFYERVVHGGERPAISRKWPTELSSLMTECWDADLHNRPRFRDIVTRIDAILDKEKGGNDGSSAKKTFLPKITGMIDRHSTWF